jgi:hypothetical protein
MVDTRNESPVLTYAPASTTHKKPFKKSSSKLLYFSLNLKAIRPKQ